MTGWVILLLLRQVVAKKLLGKLGNLITQNIADLLVHFVREFVLLQKFAMVILDIFSKQINIEKMFLNCPQVQILII